MSLQASESIVLFEGCIENKEQLDSTDQTPLFQFTCHSPPALMQSQIIAWLVDSPLVLKPRELKLVHLFNVWALGDHHCILQRVRF